MACTCVTLLTTCAIIFRDSLGISSRLQVWKTLSVNDDVTATNVSSKSLLRWRSHSWTAKISSGKLCDNESTTSALIIWLLPKFHSYTFASPCRLYLLWLCSHDFNRRTLTFFADCPKGSLIRWRYPYEVLLAVHGMYAFVLKVRWP